MPSSIRPGDTLAGRYRLDDLLSESGSGRFWRAHDRVLQRHVALHVMSVDDDRVPLLLDAARRSATVADPRVLRVLDAERRGPICFVVNEWGYGTSLDIALANNGHLSPRHAAWVVAEVADSVAGAHARGVSHGRLVPENVLIDQAGAVRIIGFCVDAALHGASIGTPEADLRDLGGLLHASLTGKWAGSSSSAVPAAPQSQGRVLRPRQVRAGVPRPLDDLVDELLNPTDAPSHAQQDGSATAVAETLVGFVGDPSGIPESLARANPLRRLDVVVLPQVPEMVLRSDLTGAEQEDDGRVDAVPATPAPEQPVERPLFAPDPTGDAPARKPRDGVGAPAPDEYWPADTSTGITRPVPHEDPEPDRPAGRVPGRRSLRVAAAVMLAILLLVGVAIVYNQESTDGSPGTGTGTGAELKTDAVGPIRSVGRLEPPG